MGMDSRDTEVVRCKYDDCLGMINYYEYYVCRHWAEKEVSFVTLLTRLQHYSKLYPNQSYFQPSKLLETIVECGATLSEELYFRKKK